MSTSRVAVLIDGTALYFRSREGRSERLDYEALDRVLRAKAQVTGFNPAIFFTTYDPTNEGQSKFLTFLRSRLQWAIETRPVWDADPLPRDAPWERSERRNEFIRFDAPIAFAVGRLVDRCKQVIVISDSFGLEQPLQAAGQMNIAKIILAFFAHHIDPRWPGSLKGDRTHVEFWDLDESEEAIFGRDSKPKSVVTTTLARLV